LPRKNEPTERTCIVTREQKPVAAMIRFVVAPNGEVVADLRRRLPGRGVWVTAKSALVATAEKKHLFGRGFGEPVKVAPGLADRVAGQLLEAASSALSLARKAGSAVSGFGKVEAALAGDKVVALLHAREAAPDGVAKLAAAARRAQLSPEIVGMFRGEELDLAFGRTNVIHAALLAGPASDNVLARVRALTAYLGEDEAVRIPTELE
jgi:predicted RNA-binding protein YlxR (DUF448 family)